MYTPPHRASYAVPCCNNRYGCQVRDILRRETNEDIYLRPGNFWFRNVVHGKPLKDGSKGKRYGHPIQKGFKAQESHKNLYTGKYTAHPAPS